MKKRHYFFDYAASTPLEPEVFSAMRPFLKKEFGNPGSLYRLGRNAKKAVSEAATLMAGTIGCQPDELVYTSSATEADNLAILGTARANKDKGKRIIVSSLEHKGVLAACRALEKEGFEIVKLPVLKNGLIDLAALEESLTPDTILVSVTMADNETGTIQPIKEISKILKNFRNGIRDKRKGLSIPHTPQYLPLIPYFHTDASQAAGYLDLNVGKLGVDMMTISAHKIYGPKGIGLLYVKRGTRLSPLIYGGGQQNSLRSGTENVPAIMGFARALELARRRGGKESIRIKKLRDALQKGILKSIPKAILNGHPQKRLPNFLNISILDVEGEALLLHLDELGISASTGSACNSTSLEPSYILQALGYPYEYIHGSLRFTLGKHTTAQDVNYVLKHLPKVVEKLRAISPLNVKLKIKN